MRTMVIGLEPDYNYPGDLKVWRENNTKYASNHGASLICRALLKQFEADFINDLSNYKELEKKYDLCIVAFATHITQWRDVTYYADFLESSNIKVAAFSLGVQDYTKTISGPFRIHFSMIRLLKIVEKRSGWIGVRGPRTAALLAQNGFSKVLPVGCPTFYVNLKNNLNIRKGECRKPLIVYHRTIAENNWHLCKDVDLLGQDFLDESIFTDNYPEDSIKGIEEAEYKKYPNGSQKIEFLRQNGTFFTSFEKWFNFIGDHDFVIGPRLHGCIAALIQGIPAVMLYRDMRVKEIADFYMLPSLSYETASQMSIHEIFHFADYQEFNENYKLRFNNYVAFLNMITDRHKLENNDKEFVITTQDHISMNYAMNKKIADIENSLIRLGVYNTSALGKKKYRRVINKIVNKIRSIRIQ